MMNKRAFSRSASLLGILLAAGSLQPAASLPLRFGDEASADINNFKFVYNPNNTFTATFDIQNGYVFCANTPWFGNTTPQSEGANGIMANGLGAHFKFGEVNTNNVAIVPYDVRSLKIGVGGSAVAISGSNSNGPGTLACYTLDSAGNRVAWYNGLFVDTFEDAPSKSCPGINPADPCILVKVKEPTLDTPPNDNRKVYTYYIDYYLPAANALYLVRDGYDSTYINGAVAQWCDVAANVVQCPGFPNNPYFTRTVDLSLAGSAAAAKQGRIIVNRVTNAGVVDLSGIGTPLVIAALFPEYAELSVERQLNNNVSAGGGTASNFAPVINTTGTDLKGLVEGGSSLSVGFQLNDDSSEAPGNLLRASVSVNFNGESVSPVVDCGSAAPLPGPGATRNCSFNITLPSSNFATDSAPAVFAPGVIASVSITATDPQGSVSTVTGLPMHVTSSDNDLPSFTFAQLDVFVEGTPLPTITCSLSALSTACGGTGHSGTLKVLDEANGVKAVPNFVTAVAGPADAVDERAAQTVSFVIDTSTGRNGNIKCVLDNGSLEIFQPSTGGPRLSVAGAGNFNLSFGLNQVNIGSATCDVAVADAQSGGFPAAQVSQVSPVQQFRIVVTN